MKKSLCLALALTSQLSLATTQVFLSLEYQAQTAPNAGTIRSGDPAGDASFADFLNSANLVSADILSGDSCGSIADGVYATWGHVTTLGQTDINLGSGTASVSIAGWDTETNTLTTPS